MKNSKPTRKELSFENRKASFDVAVEQTYEAGLVLTGEEIKSIRAERAQLTGSYLKLHNGNLQVIGLQLSTAPDPQRLKKLLLNQAEIEQIKAAFIKGKIAVPLKLYLKRGWAKLLIGVGTPRKKYDKRALLKQRDLQREASGELKRLS